MASSSNWRPNKLLDFSNTQFRHHSDQKSISPGIFWVNYFVGSTEKYRRHSPLNVNSRRIESSVYETKQKAFESW